MMECRTFKYEYPNGRQNKISEKIQLLSGKNRYNYKMVRKGNENASQRRTTKKVQDPLAPKKPKNAFFLWKDTVSEAVKQNNAYTHYWELGKIFGEMWKNLPKDYKALFEEEQDRQM